jgi:2-oxoglutarate ferredoxin oxidoreductase subunit alpha
MGQIIHPIKEAVAGKCQVQALSKIGGEIHTPEEVLQALEGVVV